MPNRIHVYVVDDHALFREGLLRLLHPEVRIRVVGGAGTIADALSELSSRRVDVLIVDYDLGGDTALTLVRALREREFGGRILLVTAGLSDEQALTLIQHGICGIVHKHQHPAELLQSILSVADGRVLLDQDYLRRLVSEASATRQPIIRLTERERQVLDFVVEGLSNKEIALELGLSESAVKSSLQQLFGKTGVRTRSQLVRVALEELQR